MSAGTDMLEILQADVVAVLQNHPVLSTAAILPEDEGDMEKKVLRALGPLNTGSGGARGLALVVMLPEAAAVDENLPGPLAAATLEIQVIEHPLANRGAGGTGVRSSVAALEALSALHHRSLGGCALVAGQRPVVPVAGMKPGYLSHSVSLTARFPGLPAPVRPAGVAAAWLGDDTLELTCPTSGAVIWYTTDGTFPTPTNTGATDYTAPIAGLYDGDTIRAVAYLSGYMPGDCTTVTVVGGEPATGDWSGLTAAWQTITTTWQTT